MTNFYVFYVCIYILFQLLFHHSIAHTVCTRRVSGWCRLTARDSRERQRGKLHIKFYNLRAREGHFACVKHFQAKWTGTEKKYQKWIKARATQPKQRGEKQRIAMVTFIDVSREATWSLRVFCVYTIRSTWMHIKKKTATRELEEKVNKLIISVSSSPPHRRKKNECA